MAKAMGVSRASLYYVATQDKKDWALKIRMEEALHKHPSYGARRLAQALGVNRKRAQRVMRIYGIKPYRRHGKKYKKSKAERHFPNLLLGIMPSYLNHVWATDFTELIFRGKKVYVSTIIDLFTRQLMGIHVGTRKGSQLTIQTLASALFNHPRPVIFHSDNGREYEAKVFVSMLERYGITISRSRPGSPWENGYQESFYDKFKMDLGDPNRFRTLGELVAEIYRTAWDYNHTRIHSALKMPPSVFAEKIAA
jgi:transposase InsO family protein